MIDWLASDSPLLLLRAVGAVAILWFSLWLLIQTGIPSHSALQDHISHMYKAYLASRNETHAIHWNGENIFLIAPVPYIVFWLFTRVFDFVWAYKLVYVLTLLFFVLLSHADVAFLLPLVTASGFASIVVGRFPGILAHLIGILALYAAYRKQNFSISALLVVLSVLSQPTVGMLYALALFALALDTHDRGNITLSGLSLITLLVYGIILEHTFPQTTSVLRANVFGAASVLSVFRAITVLANNYWVLLIAFVVFLLSFRRGRRPFFSLYHILLSLYFLFGWAILPAWFPLAKVWPLTYVIYFSFVLLLFRGLFRVRDTKIAYAFLSLYLLVSFSLGVFRVLPLGGGRVPIVGIRTLPYTWHNTALESDLNLCARYLSGKTVYFLYDPDTNSCGGAYYLNPYLNMKYNAITPEGGIFEITPFAVREKVSHLLAACREGTLSASSPHSAFVIPLVAGHLDFCCGDLVCIGPIS